MSSDAGQRSANGRRRVWRRQVRPKILRSAAVATKSLQWSPKLFEVLLEELHIDASLEELLGRTVRRLPTHRYPQAIALALILRHSWRDDDLADIVERLGLIDTAEH